MSYQETEDQQDKRLDSIIEALNALGDLPESPIKAQLLYDLSLQMTPLESVELGKIVLVGRGGNVERANRFQPVIEALWECLGVDPHCPINKMPPAIQTALMNSDESLMRELGQLLQKIGSQFPSPSETQSE